MNQIIHNLSNEDYHQSAPYNEYISSSQLKWYLKSPRYYKYMLEHPQEQNDAMRFGSLFHDCMAGLGQGGSVKDVLDAIVVFEPPTNKTTGKATLAYQEAYLDFAEKTQGRLIVSIDDKEALTGMLTSLINSGGATSEQVRLLLKWGKPEVSIFYETEDGIKIKIRPDLLTPKKIVDWKSTSLDDLTEESINREILRYGYHISAAQYQWVVHKVTGKWLDFYLVFVQKQAPYDCVMVNMANYGYHYKEEWDMLIPGPGALEFERLLGLHIKCVKSNEWPGAETFIPGDKYRIMEIEPPRYYERKFFDEI